MCCVWKERERERERERLPQWRGGAKRPRVCLQHEIKPPPPRGEWWRRARTGRSDGRAGREPTTATDESRDAAERTSHYGFRWPLRTSRSDVVRERAARARGCVMILFVI